LIYKPFRVSYRTYRRKTAIDNTSERGATTAPRRETMSAADEPAFPTHPNKLPGHFSKDGLTKREYFAAMAMQGLLANSTSSGHIRSCALDSVDAADALLLALERKPE
jgi:hypothetical protein